MPSPRFHAEVANAFASINENGSYTTISVGTIDVTVWRDKLDQFCILMDTHDGSKKFPTMDAAIDFMCDALAKYHEDKIIDSVNGLLSMGTSTEDVLDVVNRTVVASILES